MKKAEHTAAPWVYKAASNRDVFSTKYPNVQIGSQNIIFRSEKEGDANAHLVAAAPDLLAATKLAFEIIEGILENESLSDCAANNLASVSGALEEAIAKARGEQ